MVIQKKINQHSFDINILRKKTDSEFFFETRKTNSKNKIYNYIIPFINDCCKYYQ